MSAKKPPRQYHTGTLFQRKDGRWIGRYRDGYTAAGNPKFRTVSDMDKGKAQSKLNKAVRARNEDARATTLDERATVKSWLDDWLPMRQAQVRPKTYSTDRSAVTQWIVPTLGARKLVDLTPADVRKLDAAVKRKRSLATVKRTRDVLILALKAASLEGHAIPPRIFQVESPRLGVTDRAALPVEDAVKLLQSASGGERQSRWVAALLQGMRQGECLGLTWDRVDLENGVIDVSWQMQELVSEHGCKGDCGRKLGAYCYARRFRIPDGFESRQIEGRWHWTRPKTKAGRRLIPLVPWMTAALRKWRSVAPASDYDLVWPSPGGGPLDVKDDLSAFHALQESAGVTHPSGRRYHVHEARHTTATLLMALGVSEPVIVALMGHSSILSTRTYQHSDLMLARTALDGVAERLQLTT